ncbi:hypothetical protein [uncultured Deefgea sp.]|uniref:hypothetical protein n=1 Tax=uncultured Deefgea sp. TaxID=1304914 RepID=UPI00259A3323|nr:hypothetical protein [uncultured Deefgea sp.]
MSEMMVSRTNPLARAANGMNNAAAAMLELQKSPRSDSSNRPDQPESSDLASRRSAEKPPVDAVSISAEAKKKQSEDAEQIASRQTALSPAPPAAEAKAAEPAAESTSKNTNSRPAAAAAAQYAQQQASANAQARSTPNLSESA